MCNKMILHVYVNSVSYSHLYPRNEKESRMGNLKDTSIEVANLKIITHVYYDVSFFCQCTCLRAMNHNHDAVVAKTSFRPKQQSKRGVAPAWGCCFGRLGSNGASI